MIVQELIDQKKTGIVLLYGTACPPCQRLKPILTTVAEGLGITLYQANVASELDFARANAIRGVPTVLALRDGLVSVLWTGEISKHAMTHLIVDALHA